MTRESLALVAWSGLAAIVCGSSPASAQPPSLGAAQSFAVLGGQSVTVAGVGTTITGNVGVSPGTSITGIPGGGSVAPPFGTHSNDTAAMDAQSSAASLYFTLAGTAGAAPIAAELGGITLPPGIYSFASTANIAAGTTLTLNGGGIYIFKVGSAITANVGSNIVLSNGASACNVFWQVTSAATINGLTFAGTVVAQAAVTLGVGARLTGRALTTAVGSVTMDGANTIGGCSDPGGGCPTIALGPVTLSNGMVGVAYSQTITGNGGAAPYSFAVTAGTLPPGLTLTSAGVLAGNPTTAGPSSFTVRTTDTNGCAATLSYAITIAAAPPEPPVCPAITLAPATLPNGTAGVAYSQTITGNGGAAPYVFAVTSGTLPPGLSLTTAGLLAGTPGAAGTSTFTIRATDANGCAATLSYAITIAAAPPEPPVCPAITLAPATFPGGTAGVAYSQTITGSGGTAPYAFGVAAGTLPPGVTLTSAGVLAGTPATAGVSAFTIRGTDANGCVASAAHTIAIAAAPLPPPVCPAIALSPTTLPNGAMGVLYSQTIAATGGAPPYSFGVTAGALPAGLALTSAGGLSGTPSTPGASAFAVRATSANGCFAELPFTIFIPAPVPALPRIVVVLLAFGLAGLGYFWLRRPFQRLGVRS